MSALYRAMRPLLFRLDPELAHGVAITGPQVGIVAFRDDLPADPALAVSVLGLDFPNPVGLAAGFDKNAEVADAMLAQGFGFVEVGSLTPSPQPGNPAPRLFRLAEDRGHHQPPGIQQSGPRSKHDGGSKAAMPEAGIIGVNIGAGKDAVDPAADYVAGISSLNDVADYLTVNISSPNTPGLRSLQARPRLEALLGRLSETRAKLARAKPLLIKIAPDLDDGELEDISVVALRGGIDGIIVSNTTVSRPPLKSANAGRTWRSVGSAAVRTVDAQARPPLCAHLRQAAAHRGGRDRFCRDRVREVSRRRISGAALFGDGVPGTGNCPDLSRGSVAPASPRGRRSL